MIVEIVNPQGKVSYTRPHDHQDVLEALNTPGYSVRGSEAAVADSLKRVVSLPRGPWIASQQHSMRFMLSQDGEILWRCDWMPMPILKAMVEAANKQANAPHERPHD